MQPTTTPTTGPVSKRNEDGEELVWSIHDNAWVTRSYWRYINNEAQR